jgi:hypothetical protein
MGAVGVVTEVLVEGGDGFFVAFELEEGIAAFVDEVAAVRTELVGAIVAGDGEVELLEFGEGESAFVPEAGVIWVMLEGLVVEGDRFWVFFGFFEVFALAEPVEDLGGVGAGEEIGEEGEGEEKDG